jgi:hypothetical protein
MLEGVTCDQWTVLSTRRILLCGEVFSNTKTKEVNLGMLCESCEQLSTHFSILKFQILPKSKTLRRAFMGENEGLGSHQNVRTSQEIFPASITCKQHLLIFQSNGIRCPTLHMHACNELWPQVHEFVTFM